MGTPPIPVVATDDHLLHDNGIEVEWGVPAGHWERPVRAEVIHRRLATDDRFVLRAPDRFGIAPIEAVHDPGLVRFLERAWFEFQRTVRAQREVMPDTVLHPALRVSMGPAPEPAAVEAALGYWCFETMTPLLEGTFAAAVAAVDTALTAATLVCDGAPIAYGLCRPPGHHATAAAYGGYCYLNNAAITAEWLRSRTGAKVAVIDVDYHHGNGTQQIFYERADVFYGSIHGDPNRAYPYFTGHAEETGSGAGRGATLNLPLPAGADDGTYLATLARLVDAVDASESDVLVISLGVDTAATDPIGDFGLTPEAFGPIGAMLAGLGRPMVLLQEGGYDVTALADHVRSVLLGAASVVEAR